MSSDTFAQLNDFSNRTVVVNMYSNICHLQPPKLKEALRIRGLSLEGDDSVLRIRLLRYEVEFYHPKICVPVEEENRLSKEDADSLLLKMDLMYDMVIALSYENDAAADDALTDTVDEDSQMEQSASVLQESESLADETIDNDSSSENQLKYRLDCAKLLNIYGLRYYSVKGCSAQDFLDSVQDFRRFSKINDQVLLEILPCAFHSEEKKWYRANNFTNWQSFEQKFVEDFVNAEEESDESDTESGSSDSEDSDASSLDSARDYLEPIKRSVVSRISNGSSNLYLRFDNDSEVTPKDTKADVDTSGSESIVIETQAIVHQSDTTESVNATQSPNAKSLDSGVNRDSSVSSESEISECSSADSTLNDPEFAPIHEKIRFEVKNAMDKREKHEEPSYAKCDDVQPTQVVVSEAKTSTNCTTPTCNFFNFYGSNSNNDATSANCTSSHSQNISSTNPNVVVKTQTFTNTSVNNATPVDKLYESLYSNTVNNSNYAWPTPAVAVSQASGTTASVDQFFYNALRKMNPEYQLGVHMPSSATVAKSQAIVSPITSYTTPVSSVATAYGSNSNNNSVVSPVGQTKPADGEFVSFIDRIRDYQQRCKANLSSKYAVYNPTHQTSGYYAPPSYY